MPVRHTCDAATIVAVALRDGPALASARDYLAWTPVDVSDVSLTSTGVHPVVYLTPHPLALGAPLPGRMLVALPGCPKTHWRTYPASTLAPPLLGALRGVLARVAPLRAWTREAGVLSCDVYRALELPASYAASTGLSYLLARYQIC
jgi:hypothetical protein